MSKSARGGQPPGAGGGGGLERFLVLLKLFA
jgi:hypothetical protein